MKKVLALLLAVGAYSAYGQVGIGTPLPNSSSQLEVVGSDRGILIPRLALTSTTDTTTITNGNVNSLLVFNTATAADIKPGYYYWYDNRWNRIVVASDLGPSQANVIYNPVTNEFTYIDNSGTIQNINIAEIVQANETITTFVDNGDGTVTYTNEAGIAVTVNLGQGLQGPAGPAGPQGPAGQVGVQGLPGTSGTPGTPGSGHPGAPGAGITIVNNDSGTWVYDETTNTWTNINGPAGPAGAQGPQGPAGQVGVQGLPGTSGTPGTPGSGQPGAPGAGITIVNNDSGTWVYDETTNTWTNINGPAGPAGAQGPQGPAGQVGVQGLPGTSGTPGTPG